MHHCCVRCLWLSLTTPSDSPHHNCSHKLDWFFFSFTNFMISYSSWPHLIPFVPRDWIITSFYIVARIDFHVILLYPPICCLCWQYKTWDKNKLIGKSVTINSPKKKASVMGWSWMGVNYDKGNTQPIDQNDKGTT